MRQLSLAVRHLRRDPVFSTAAVLTLALGIGLATAVFSVANALLFRDLPVQEQERLVVLWGSSPEGNDLRYPLTHAQAKDFAGASRAFQSVAFHSYYGALPTPVREGERITRLRQAMVSGNYFDVLGTRPAIGRALTEADDRVGARAVAILSFDAWQRSYGGSADVLGKQIVVHASGVAHEIVGVMPQGLDLPRGTDFWIPIAPASATPTGELTAVVHLMGRLAPGATANAATTELGAFFGRPETPVWLRNLRGAAMPLPQLLLGDVRPAVIAFVVACALLLLITCINVGNLLLVRGLGRLREFAVRAAIGAHRHQIVRHLLLENAVLALLGGLLGMLVASAAVSLFVSFAPNSVPRLSEIQVDRATLAAAFGITSLALVVFGLFPALATTRVDPVEALRGGRSGTSRGQRRITELLVAGQIALAVLVLSAAALVGRSLIRLQGAELALRADNVLIGELAFRADQVEGKAKQLALLDRLVPAVRSLPGVLSVSPVVAIPFSGPGGWDGKPAAKGQTPEEAAANPMLNMEVVVPDYFATFGLAATRGRLFQASDREDAPRVVILSEAAAERFWPGRDPVGQRVTFGAELADEFTVVGIVPETRYRDLREARASIYFPLRQSIFPFAPLTLAIRTASDPSAMVPALRQRIGELEPGVELANAAPFGSYLAGPLAQPRLNALLLGIFSAASVTLAAIGLFGVMMTMVRRRTREIGVRMALGARAGHVRTMVLRRGIGVAAAGTVAGLIASLAANRALSSLLFNVSTTDAVTLAAVAVVILTVAFLATAIPARSGTRIDPVRALRAD